MSRLLIFKFILVQLFKFSKSNLSSEFFIDCRVNLKVRGPTGT